MSFLMLYILRISPLEGTYWKFGKWLCCWGLQTLTLFKTKISHFITLFCEKKAHFWWPFKSIFIFHSELSNKTTWKKKLKQENKIHLLDILKVCWYRTCRQRTAKVYPLFKAFRLQKIPCSRRLELYNPFKNQGLQNLTFFFVTKPN